jgi:hypothetical protein
MKMVLCRACSEPINAYDRACPLCGTATPPRRPSGTVSGVAVVAIVLVVLTTAAVVIIGR